VRRTAALVVDAAFVLLFATLGRVSHAEGLTVPGVVSVAWLFLTSLAAGWLVAARVRAWPVGLPGAGTVWLVTALLGLALRVATGGGFAWSFGLVTVAVLGIFIIGWRCTVEVARFGARGIGSWAQRSAGRR